MWSARGDLHTHTHSSYTHFTIDKFPLHTFPPLVPWRQGYSAGVKLYKRVLSWVCWLVYTLLIGADVREIRSTALISASSYYLKKGEQSIFIRVNRHCSTFQCKSLLFCQFVHLFSPAKFSQWFSSKGYLHAGQLHSAPVKKNVIFNSHVQFSNVWVNQCYWSFILIHQ